MYNNFLYILFCKNTSNTAHKIEETVELYNLKEKGEKLKKSRAEIIHLKKLASDLKINRNVAIYEYAMQKVVLGEEIHSYLSVADKLRDDPNVQKYREIIIKIYWLERQAVEYYRGIQIALRNRLAFFEEPDIYVYYGTFDDKQLTRNIISDDLMLLDDANTVIMPNKELKSRKKARHFYNKTSFKYLEALINDNNYSLEEKNLGKVKILTKENK